MDTSTKSSNKDDSLFGIGISKRQMKRNLHQIEEGLKRMQDEIEKRQRENSISYGQDLEQLIKELQAEQFGNKRNTNEEEEEQKKLESGEDQEQQQSDEERKGLLDKENNGDEEQGPTDKKND